MGETDPKRRDFDERAEAIRRDLEQLMAQEKQDPAKVKEIRDRQHALFEEMKEHGLATDDEEGTLPTPSEVVGPKPIQRLQAIELYGEQLRRSGDESIRQVGADIIQLARGEPL